MSKEFFSHFQKEPFTCFTFGAHGDNELDIRSALCFIFLLKDTLSYGLGIPFQEFVLFFNKHTHGRGEKRIA